MPRQSSSLICIQISNDLVRNQLIINQSIEQVVLIRSRDEATNFMDSGGPRLRNVRMCFCMSDRSRREGHSLTFNPQTGSSNLSPIQEYRGQHRMQADKTAQVQDEKENLASIRREVANFEAAAQDAQNHLNTCQARIQAHKRQKTALKIQMDEAHDSVGTLEDEVNACTPDVAAIATLEQDLAVAKGQVELDEGQYANFLVEKDQADAEARSLKSLLDDATKVLQESQLRLDKVSTKITTLTQRRVDALRRKNEALTKVEDAEKNEAEWDEQRSALLDKIQNQSTKASEICSRVPVPAGETFESLGRQVEANRVAREAAEKELGGSEEELVTIANDAKKAYVDAQKLVGDTHNVRRVLKVALQTRQERWKTFRMKISMRARVTFNYLLSERRFRGSLSVDHKNQRLDIHIQPDITVMSDAGRQTKTLSGGEKSFSTICLLLSLWDAMGSPIRCLDEFDVFMDQANRDVTMKLIIGAARKSVGRQYILITPQAISNAGVGNADDVKIIRYVSCCTTRWLETRLTRA
jgi:chromosome segregation ATPase